MEAKQDLRDEGQVGKTSSVLYMSLHKAERRPDTLLTGDDGMAASLDLRRPLIIEFCSGYERLDLTDTMDTTVTRVAEASSRLVGWRPMNLRASRATN